ncbi:SAM-dependent methyltransferase [Pseudocolwellia agarivorans]|uniref:SAM-dependent methyltransferase n=1 Tax=Pseudocolwellia agarivorans TaxID=1911682 RepID=UPI0009865280|nr:cyclopropane-fatty-acyl-phospholipid synthase family protein [Pseudocolwellia agarivorans]
MEQTNHLILNKKLTWFEQKCRALVLNTLNKMKDACIEIHENTYSEICGDPKASLKAHMHIHDASIYTDIIKGGSIAAAEGYLSQKWTSTDLTQLVRVLARNQKALDSVENQSSWLNTLQNKLLNFKNANTLGGSKKNILAHYDLGNDLYTRFLDPEMMYSCALYSDEHTTLDEAQRLKLKSICDKLNLTSEDHLVEIGTGWGGLAIYAATHYGCQVTTTTISDAQFDYAQERVNKLGLNEKITLLKKDYRLLEGQYDKLVSIEMIEAVGHDFMGEFFKQCNSLLKPNGKMLIQAITIADQRYDNYRKNTDFIQKYIFPGGCLPSIAVISEHIALCTDMMIDNVTDMGLHYARTLSDWRKNFDKNWADIQPFGFDDQFKRLWHYYFAYCEGAFIERVISTHHIVARKPEYKDANDETILTY